MLDEAKIRWTLKRVAKSLRRREPHGMTDLQIAKRQWAIRELDNYRRHETLPRNDVRGCTPIFRDDSGSLCAVAHLVAASSNTDVVDRVARTQNRARVSEIIDSALGSWAEAHGLSVAELEEIQPAYTGVPRASTIFTLFGGGIGLISVAVGFSRATVRALFDRRVARVAAAVASVIGIAIMGYALILNAKDEPDGPFRFSYAADPKAMPVAIGLFVASAIILMLTVWRGRKIAEDRASDKK